MAHTSPPRHDGTVIIGLVLGGAASAWMIRAARDHELAGALPSPWVTACLGFAVVALGWVIASAAPRFAAALAGASTPGAIYGAIMLSMDGNRVLSIGWSAVPVALGCLALGAGLHAAQAPHKPWSARRANAPRVPRVRTR